MQKRIWIFFLLILILGAGVSLTPLQVGSEENRILAVVQKMDAFFKTVENYSCEVEQIFYQNGEESQRYRFKYYFKRGKKIRVDFSHPYSSLTIFYRGGDEDATVMPFRSLPALKFRFSIGNPIILTPTGQRINQTDMEYFLSFLLKNHGKVKQKMDEFSENEDQIKFWFWAMDYINEKELEKYQFFISKRSWLPIRIERYHLDGKPIEVSIIQNYTINAGLQDKLFNP